MDNRKQQPFYVGDRVVALVTDRKFKRCVKGHVYRILGIRLSCHKWVINIGAKTDRPYLKCGGCGGLSHTNGIGWIASEYFAPYDPPAIEIPEELLEVTEERIDCKPEKIEAI